MKVCKLVGRIRERGARSRWASVDEWFEFKKRISAAEELCFRDADAAAERLVDAAIYLGQHSSRVAGRRVRRR